LNLNCFNCADMEADAIPDVPESCWPVEPYPDAASRSIVYSNLF